MIKKIYQILILNFIFLILIFIIIISGCNTKQQDKIESPGLLFDDGLMPESPKWDKNQPIVVQKINEKNYQVILSWEPVTTNRLDAPKSNIIGYNVYRKKQNGIEKKIATLSLDQNYYVDKSLELIEGEKFTYVVTAFDNMLRESAKTDGQLAIIQPEKKAIPKPPTKLYFAPIYNNVTNNQTANIIISWNSPTENIDNSTPTNIIEFEIESRLQSQPEWKTIAKIPGDKNIYIDSNLPFGSYFYRIRAKNSFGNYSQYVDGSFTLSGKTDNIPPGPITNLEVWYQNGRNFLKWVNPTKDANGKTFDLAGIKIYRKTIDSQEPYQLIKVLPPETSYVDYNINLDTYYIYTISTFDSFGNESTLSKPISTKPQSNFLEPPTNIEAKLDKNSNLILTWNEIPNAKSYNVYKANFEDAYYTLIGNTKTNSYILNVPYNNVFYYKVTALNDKNEESSFSNPVKVYGNIIYKTIECETYLNDISKGVNAIAKPFQIEVTIDNYFKEDDKNAYLRFSPISIADGEAIRGIPISGKDVDAVDDYFEINQFLSAGTYKCEIWIRKTPDSGIYKIEAGGNTYDQINCYSNNKFDILKFPISFVVNDDPVYHGKNITFKFTCQGKSEESSNYVINLDKIIIYR